MKDEKQKRCFVVGPIGATGSETRNQADTLLHYIIRPALMPLGYKVDRADDEKSPGNISDHVINSVLDADLVVADLTGPNANAFYELGIRHMKEMPVIHMILDGQRPPFDVSNFNTIFYHLDNPAQHQQAAEQLKAHALATEAAGFKVSNPITAARGHQQLALSADPLNQTVRVLMEKVSALSEEVERIGKANPMAIRNNRSRQISMSPDGKIYPDSLRELWNLAQPVRLSETDQEALRRINNLSKESDLHDLFNPYDHDDKDKE